ncbi:MAG: type IV secretory system conjugative DNA transfer family protein [Chloroflexota bacterium]
MSPRSMFDRGAGQSVLFVPASASFQSSAEQVRELIKQSVPAIGETISFEILLKHDGPSYFIRVAAGDSGAMQSLIHAMTGAAASVVPDPTDGYNGPADTQYTAGLRREARPYLPMATLTTGRPGQPAVDPLEGLLPICPLLGPGEFVLYQLLVRAPDWKQVYQIESMVNRESYLNPQAKSGRDDQMLDRQGRLTGLAFGAGSFAVVFGVVGLIGPFIANSLGLVNVAAVAASAGCGYVCWRIWNPLAVKDDGPISPALSEQKVSSAACSAHLRLSVHASRREEIDRALRRALSVMDDRADGNGFVLKPASFSVEDVERATGFTWMNAAEVAAYWHQFASSAPRDTFIFRPPQAGFLPDHGFMVGHSGRPPTLDPVHFNLDLMTSRISLFLGGQGGGKTVFRRRVLRGAIAEISEYGESRPTALMNIDPLSGGARFDAGVVPRALRRRVRIITTALNGYSISVNPLWQANDDNIPRQADALVTAWEYYYSEAEERSWGDRMRILLSLLFNTIMWANFARGAPVYGLLDALAMLYHDSYRQSLIVEAGRKALSDGWRQWFDTYNARERMEVINPVVNKLMTIRNSPQLTRILGVSTPTVDLGQMVDNADIITLDVPQEELGAEMNGLLLATVLNMLMLHIQSRHRVEEAQRSRLLMLFDEPTLIPADLARQVNILRQMGSSAMYFSQTITHFNAVKNLRESVEANLGAMFFNYVMSDDDLRLADKQLEETIPHSALMDTPPGCVFVRFRGAPPFSMRILADEPVDAETRACTDEILQAEIERGTYRTHAEIDRELLAAERRWETFRLQDIRQRMAKEATKKKGAGKSEPDFLDDVGPDEISPKIDQTLPWMQPDEGDDDPPTAGAGRPQRTQTPAPSDGEAVP